MIPYGKQSLEKKDIEAVCKTLASDFLTQGPKVAEFERKLASYCGVKYAVVVSSGTSALHLSYLAAGLKKGDEVITAPNTFVATTNMLLAVGAKPVFCDIRLDTYNIDESRIESLITKKTKAIVPIHFAGAPCEMDKIIKIAQKHKLLVIEDGCHALGAGYKNKKIGNIGDMTVFSFHPVKSITTGEGGAILTNNKKYYEKMLRLRSHGVHKDKSGFNIMTEMGYNYRMTDIQAALGVSQLAKLDKFMESRLKVISWYKKYLSDSKNIILPKPLGDGIRSANHIYVVRVADYKDRLPLYNYLKKNGIEVNFHYPAVYGHPYYRQNGFKFVFCPIMDEYARTAITIPLYPSLKENEIKYISDLIKSFYEK